MRKRRIAILGSTGSIGTQTLDVIRRHPDMFEVELISARRNVDLLTKQAIEFDAANVVICEESKYKETADALQDKGIKVWSGVDSLCELVKMSSVDIVVGAMVGFSGLRPTLAALEAGKTVALANKETLVAAGPIVIRTMLEHNAVILPVDSEHSAIFQCLLASKGNSVEKIHLTASGGPFRTWERARIAAATAQQALKHPNWNMGAKVTIDSATMMNKGFEVIEAKWLFDLNPDQINVVVHPESIIHSMVEFEDGAVIAQMGCPDMREPIGFALSYPQRVSVGNKKLDFASMGHLSFEAPDMKKFPCLELAYDAIKRGGNVPCALNAANEVTVAAYLKGLIGFYDIARINEKCMLGMNFAADPSLEDIFLTNKEIATIADGYIN
ncbi:MAG: 1-deoxy-D-xylulose-5-phosphate reductoisomerase [Bacteroides sp.]|nr:1-deoxy-D-xylulose-5-phosphate reductoisomerase [Bacteroidales bacterium]MCI6680077.1 1-deoxy-D-xylulose-5-phosphate reductoisomerase [Bacteroides sp.]MDD7490102.1 1-deoxy-D-xylulose-5-phosphate reductoisomerase [Bacteroides sp.]MDY5890930.1 1-deoxy-D-xylulose-5-phosphate reductoisomerase [Candidatus Cryptobacteroides sp.]CCX55419.1 1-deoxy-D-xylulose 5-phosphate reductoisomerase [Bacteroides sp. CAG:1060]